MKQFYEAYAPSSGCVNFWKGRQAKENDQESEAKSHKREMNAIVSSIVTQFGTSDNQYIEFVSSVLTQLSWTHHLMILSKTKTPEENPSIGILLCKGKDTEVVEYSLARNVSPALIADYETRLIDKDVLRKKLHELAEKLEKANNKC